jgi:nitrite reductase/ring-hydroxylating ferredoxin subunit
MSRSGDEWERRPRFPGTHYVDTRLYTDDGLFGEEREKIFGGTWIIACHESELPAAHDYRTFQHPAGMDLVMTRGADGQVRAFYNICPHRGNVLVHDPAGSARTFTCIFHAWTFDGLGNCTGIARRKEGYQDRLPPQDVEIRREMVWLDHDKPTLQSLFDTLPRHNSDHTPLSRHVTVYTVDPTPDGDSASAVSALQVFRTALDGGATELYAVGKMHDTVRVIGGAARLTRRHIRLDTRMLGIGSHIPF